MKFGVRKIGKRNISKRVKNGYIKTWLRARRDQLEEIRKEPDGLYKLIKKLMFAVVVCFAIVILSILIFIVPFLPDINNIQNLVAAQSSAIHDREGNLLYTIHGQENRANVPLSDIPQYVAKAVLAIEDDQFYNHPGIDIPGIAKAICAELYICKARGGSTITQQFIKNAFLGPERTYSRKLKEIILAFRLEKKFTKDKILEMYLNRIPYGSSIYGVEMASQTFFGKSTKNLTLAEGAILAAIPKAPTFYSPYGNNKYASTTLSADEIFKRNIQAEKDINPDFISKGLLGKNYVFEKVSAVNSKGVVEKTEKRTIYIKGRADFVLARMKELKYIEEDAYSKAIAEAEKIQFKPFSEKITAPHFVMYIKQVLEDKYGKDQVEKGGLQITTTIDGKLQTAAEDAVKKYAKMNLERYNANNASLVATDPNNGQILAMVGSADYWDDTIDGKVNVALRSRLPGSSFKPIVYATAFLQGYAPSTVLYDVKTKFGAWYEPDNYDGKHRGPVTIKQALANSLNIPAVKAGYLAGIPNVIDLAKKMGIKLDQPNDWYGLSLALGAGEARLLDMVGAYSIFANGGYKMDPVAILKVVDRNGNILEEYQKPENKTQVLDPQIAYLINSILSDVNARPEGFWRNMLSISGQINAGKTGTSNKKIGEINFPFDVWTLGYTKYLAAGVWAGNTDGTHLGLTADGINTAGRIWNDFMIAATKGKAQEAFDVPSKIKWVQISKKTGKLPSAYTPKEDIVTEAFASFAVPTEYDTSYKLVKIDKVSKKLATQYTPEAAIEEKAFFEHHSIFKDNLDWENPVRAWAKANNQDEVAPTEYDNVHTAQNSTDKPSIVIKSPQSLATVSMPSVGVVVDITSKSGVSYVEYYWDSTLIDTVRISPYKGSLQLPIDTKKDSKHTIKAIVYDSLYRSNQSSIDVKIGDDTDAPIVKFIYPGDGVTVIAGSSIPVQADAYDPNGDIAKVEFYLDGKLQYTDKTAPYIWQLTVPSQAGAYVIRATAYDYSQNKTSVDINITSKESSSVSQGSTSRITEPYKNQSFQEGGYILIQAALSQEDQKGLKELVLFAKQKTGSDIEIAKIAGDAKTGGLSFYTFIWDKVTAGTYELQLKIILSDGKVRFGERIPVVVR